MNKIFLLILIISAFLIRLLPLDFPMLSIEEARIAYRGHILSATGNDELGRRFPLIFNSLDDYKLPVVSYLTMAGVSVFGKTDLGARIPFILIGTLLVLLSFKVAQVFNPNLYFRLITAFIVATSPALIFLSKVPNEAIVLVFIFTLLFYLFISNQRSWLIILTMIGAILTSKLSWFILLPFFLFIIWFTGRKITSKKNLVLILSVTLIVVSSVLLFLSIPQSKRSLLENNFPLFSDVTIKNGIDQLRGQGMQSGWPSFVDRILFNKSHFLIVGFMHWFSHFNPAIYFGQFDPSRNVGFSSLGGWVKFLLIPFVLGLIAIFKKSDRKLKLILVLFFILTYPTLFIYPNFSVEAITLILPFMAIIIAFGFVRILEFNKKIALFGVFLILFELSLNIYNASPEYKFTNSTRPSWIKAPILDITKLSKDNKTAISDDIVSDITPFVYWYSSFNLVNNETNIDFPYKFRQSRLGDIVIIGSDDTFYKCGLDRSTYILASKRDLAKVRRWLNLSYDKAVERKYNDNLGNDIAYLLNPNICVKE